MNSKAPTLAYFGKIETAYKYVCVDVFAPIISFGVWGILFFCKLGFKIYFTLIHRTQCRILVIKKAILIKIIKKTKAHFVDNHASKINFSRRIE